MNMKPGEFIISIVTWVVMVINALLGLRFILVLFNASSTNDFVNWLYSNTQPLLEPFTGIFRSARVEGFTIEFTTLFAIVVYSLLGYLVMALVQKVKVASK